MGKITLETMLRGSQRSIRMIRNKKILESALDTKVNVTSDNLALFPELNLIVNRIKKSGNTSLVLFFHDLIGGDSLEPHAVNDEKSRRSIRGVDLSSWDNLSESKSFVCVRNPYFRAISGFLEKVGRGENTEFQAYGGYGDPTVSGFETFLDDLANSEWRSVDRHFWPQTNLLFQPAKRFYYIARLETLSDDMNAFLETMGIDGNKAASLRKPHKTEQQMCGKITNSSKRDDLLSPKAKVIIEKLYGEDFATFGY